MMMRNDRALRYLRLDDLLLGGVEQRVTIGRELSQIFGRTRGSNAAKVSHQM